MQKNRFLLILAFGLWMANGIAFADPIITVPCVGGTVVQNPDGSVTFANCTIPGGGTMSGSVHVVQGPGFVTLIASPLTLAGPVGSRPVEVGEVGYDFARGPSTLSAACSGSLDTNPPGGGGVTIGSESITCFAEATTFSFSPAITPDFTSFAGLPRPEAFGPLFQENDGFYGGPGTLKGVVFLGDLPAGEAFVLPGSAEFTAAAPEPGTWMLVILAVTAITAFRTRRRRLA